MALTIRSFSTRSVSRAVTSRRPHTRIACVNRPQLDSAIQNALQQAEKDCETSTTSKECASAWDEAEELLAAKAHKKMNDKATGADDPMEVFCQESPDADECRVHDN